MTDYEKKINELQRAGKEYEAFETDDDGYCINEYHTFTYYTEHIFNHRERFVKKIEHN